MRKMICLILFAALCGAGNAMAAPLDNTPFVVDGIQYQFLSDTEVQVADENDNSLEYSGELTIPSKINYEGKEYKVSGIGYNAFTNGKNLTSVTISEGIKSIGHGAFAGCGKLKNVKFPSQLQEIGESCFSYCQSLEFLDLSSTDIKVIPSEMCRACVALEEILLPDNINNIGYWSFFACLSLKEIKLSRNLEIIDEMAFYGCKSLKYVESYDNLKKINSSAFYNCSALEAVSLHEGLEVIGPQAFYGCTSLNGINIPGSCYAVMRDAFNGAPLSAISFSSYDVPMLSIEKCFGDINIADLTIEILGPDGIPRGGQAFISTFPELFEDKKYIDLFYFRKEGDIDLFFGDIPDVGIGISSGARIHTHSRLYMPRNKTLQIYYPILDADGPVIELRLNENVISPKIVDQYICYEVNVPEEGGVLNISCNQGAGVESVSDISLEKVIYKLDGTIVNASLENLPKGIYIVKEGNKAYKIAK